MDRVSPMVRSSIWRAGSGAGEWGARPAHSKRFASKGILTSLRFPHDTWQEQRAPDPACWRGVNFVGHVIATLAHLQAAARAKRQRRLRVATCRRSSGSSKSCNAREWGHAEEEDTLQRCARPARDHIAYQLIHGMILRAAFTVGRAWC
jgi:hypothetical protein